MAHAARITSNDTGFTVSCGGCGSFGSADDRDTAELLGRLHDRAERLAHQARVENAPDLGDLVIVLLTSTLSGLHDRLDKDGFDKAAALVADLCDLCEHWMPR